MRIKPTVVIAGLMVLGLLAFLISQASVDRPGTQSVQDDIITVTVSTTEANASATYQIRFTEGADAEHEIQHIYETLSSVPGVGHISLDPSSLQLTVTYSDAVIDEGVIRQRLTAAGYVSS